MEFQPTHQLKMSIHQKIKRGSGSTAGQLLATIEEEVCQLFDRTGDGQKWVYWFLRKHEFESKRHPPGLSWSVYPGDLKASGGNVGGAFGNWIEESFRLQEVIYMATLTRLEKNDLPPMSQA